jgi:hypothetical protein
MLSVSVVARKCDGCSKTRPEKKKASRSLRAAGLFSFTSHRGFDHPEGGRMSISVCALAKTRNSLAA